MQSKRLRVETKAPLDPASPASRMHAAAAFGSLAAPNTIPSPVEPGSPGSIQPLTIPEPIMPLETPLAHLLRANNATSPATHAAGAGACSGARQHASPTVAAAAATGNGGGAPAPRAGAGAPRSLRGGGAVAAAGPSAPMPATAPPPVPLPAAAPAASPRRGGSGPPPSPRDSRNSGLSPHEKVARILERHGQSFCEELEIPMREGSGRLAEGLWQWLCASILFSARIKSNAAVSACQALFAQHLCSPEAVRRVDKEDCRRLLHDSGYDRYDEKAASFLLEDARAVMREYGGDLGRLRDAASRNPVQERALLKKLKGVGDGGVDIFFREAQVVWHELFPFADKKALKAARLVGLREHPQSLAELVGQDKQQYVRLIAALVRIELTKTYHEF